MCKNSQPIVISMRPLFSYPQCVFFVIDTGSRIRLYFLINQRLFTEVTTLIFARY